jgi:hypothetical protein
MLAPSESELLSLWERGLARHPIDRALLLCSWARPDLPGERLAGLPLGVVNAALLRMRARLFGPRIEVQVRCEQCGEQLAAGLAIDELLADADQGDGRREVDVGDFRFRVPDSRDLASVANELDAEAAALRLLERCCIAHPGAAAPSLATVLGDVEAQLEAADPIADLRLAVSCEACGHRWDVGLDAGALLWDEVQRHANGVLGQVAALARAYGWTERDVLALSPRRRAAYLGMLAA